MPDKATLAPDASRTFTADPYKVTQAHVDAGVVANTATARGNVPNGLGDHVVARQRACRHRLRRPCLEHREDRGVQDEDGNGTADPGEQIIYSFEVVNTGNVTLHDVSVHDKRISGLVPELIDALAPKATFLFTAKPYTVTKGRRRRRRRRHRTSPQRWALRRAVTIRWSPRPTRRRSRPPQAPNDGTSPDEDSNGNGLLPDTGSPAGLALLVEAACRLRPGSRLMKRPRGSHRA